MRGIVSNVIIVLGMLLFVSPAVATYYEYSDAPGYDTAKHSTGEWQRLGTLWNAERSPGTTDSDTSDDGVFWSTDNGVTWGHETLYSGQSVIFGFQVTRAGYGRHYWDGLSAWVDWGQDGAWSASDQIMDIRWAKGDTRIADTQYRNFYNTYGRVINPNAELTHFFMTEAFTITGEMETLWLRARVACSSSILNAGGSITPYNTIYQGEVEDWQISVSPVPEPGTLVLMGIGLLGLARAGRRTFRR